MLVLSVNIRNLVKLCIIYDILKTIEYLGYYRLISEIISKKMLSFYNKMINEGMFLVTGVTARK